MAPDASPVNLGAPARAALLGAVAGLRSQLPVALLAIQAARGEFDPGAALTPKLGSRAALIGAGLTAVGELVGDKLPRTPPRIQAGPLAGRAGIGGLAGAAVFRDAGRDPWIGAALGVAGAVAATFAGYRLRKLVVEHTPLPDLVVALAEDALALGLGTLAVTAVEDD